MFKKTLINSCVPRSAAFTQYAPTCGGKISEGAKFFATKNYDAMDVDGTKLMDGNFCIYNIN